LHLLVQILRIAGQYLSTISLVQMAAASLAAGAGYVGQHTMVSVLFGRLKNEQRCSLN
jgi:hypothetical protein